MDESAANFFLQGTAWAQDMFCNFYVGKHHKSANNSTTVGAREKIGAF
jgi:hypothetical protein